eukprot:TRINITY_DN8712_c0_g1_i1.p1 TRINITY_DN8712_c0_g1~~TRINITY_DN8712_c0_g1_i1.p1  ORF type:complete len:362 (-),score=76.69 TRINITY_DN8712_c0_g1_i1:54-1139(-)
MEQPTVCSGYVGVDSGGSLSKLVYFRPKTTVALPDYVVEDKVLPTFLPGLEPDLSLDLDCQPGGILRFIKVPTSKALDFINFVKGENLHSSFKGISCTGGGAYKFKDALEDLKLPLVIVDEMESLVTGLNFVLKKDLIADEVYTVGPDHQVNRGCMDEIHYPFMIANMGTGISIIKITGPEGKDYERVSGSSIGGGTFWGLSSLLTETSDFSALRKMTPEGNSSDVDLLVGDIYGDQVDKLSHLGLAPEILACSFGKPATCGSPENLENFKPADIASSLQNMIAINTAQIVYLNAKLHGVDQVFFAGGLIQDAPEVKNFLDWGITFWSGGSMKAYFLKHDGFLGGLGAMIHPTEEKKSVTV